MGVEILNREYINQFKPASTTDWLLGNVGDIQKLVLECAFSVSKEFTEFDTLTLSDPNLLILNGGETWQDLGFYVGLECSLTLNIFLSGTPHVNTPLLRVASILGNTMEIERQDPAGNWYPQSTWGLIDFPAVIPSKIENGEVKDVKIWADVKPQGIRIDYAQFANSLAASGNLASHIDGTTTSLVMEDTDGASWVTGMTPVDFTHQLSFKSGLSLFKGTVEFLTKRRYIYTYQIELTFMLSPFFDDINNFINDVAPDSLFSGESLTDNFLITGYPVYNNPNITIKNDTKKTVQLGNTGWFDENFNQLPNLFTHTPVVYRNLGGTVVSQLDYANPITVTTTLSNINNLTGQTQFQFGFVWISQDEDYYKNVDFPFHESMKISTGGQGAALGDVFPLGSIHSAFPLLRTGYSRDGSSGLDASDISFIQSGSDVLMSVTFRPTTGFTTFMNALGDNERPYALWVSIGDQAPDTNQGDRVSLLLDYNSLDTYVEPIGEWDGLTIDFLDHPQAYTDTPVSCGNELWVEDDLLAKVSLQIDTAVSATIPIPTSITFGVLAQRASDGFQYVLDKNNVDLTQYPDPTQFNYDVSRGFKLGAGNNKNWWKVDHDATNDSGTLKGVLGWYGFKVRWEDWIKRLPTPPNDFYLNTEPQNGLNNDWEHYYSTSGWDIYFYVNIATQLGTYQNLKTMSINDYDSNADITTTILYFREDTSVSPPIKGAALLGGTDPISGLPLGVILENENVWLEITYNWVGGGPAPADWASQVLLDANSYGTNNIEVDGGGGQKSFRQKSSVWSAEADNPMIGLPNESFANLRRVSNTQIIVETRIETSKLIDSNRYKVTGRIGCK